MLGIALRRIATRALWPPVLLVVVHVLSTFVVNVYRVFPLYDVPMHLAGGMAIAFFYARSLAILREAGVLGAEDPRLEPVLLLALVCTAAVFWELVEFVLDRVLDTGAQESVPDTLGDLVMGMVGGLVYIVATIRRRRGR